MRVRYGKPIKVKSLVGNQTSLRLDTSLTNADQLSFYNGVYAYTRTYNSNLFSNINLTQNHKYYFYVNGSGFQNILKSYIYVYEGNTLYLDQPVYLSSISNTEGRSVWQFREKDIVNLSKFYIGKVNGSTPLVNYYFLIDLTDIFGSGNEPTEIQFYNKYNKYFPLIATGEEITIDDKAGSILSESISNMFKPSDRTTNVGGTGVNGNRWNGSNLSINAFSNQNNYTNVIYSFTDTGFTVQASNPDFVNGVALEIPFKVNGNCTYKLTYNYKGATSSLEYKQYNNSYVMSNLSVSGGVFTTNYDTEWVVIRFRAPGGTGAGTVGTYSNIKLIRQTPISCKVAGGSSDIYYGYNQQCENGDFSNGGLSWLAQNGSLSVSNNIASFTEGQGTISSGNALRATSYRTNQFVANHKYLVSLELSHNKPSAVSISCSFGGVFSWGSLSPNTWHSLNKIHTPNVSGTYIDYVIDYNNTDVLSTFNIRNVQLIDLTDWFGPGKEPTTVQEFKEKFTKEYYGFCPTPIKLTEKLINALPVYGYNQLIENGDFSNGVNKWYRNSTYTSLTNEDGIGVLTITSSGATTTQINLYTSNNNLQAEVGHKYFSSYTIKSNVNTAYEDQLFGGSRDYVSTTVNNVNQNWSTRERILTAINTNGWQIYLAGNYSVGNKYYFKNIQIIDLTDWYGAGSEPTTIEEFKQTFPNLYYPYSKKRLLNKYMINKLVN